MFSSPKLLNYKYGLSMSDKDEKSNFIYMIIPDQVARFFKINIFIMKTLIKYLHIHSFIRDLPSGSMDAVRSPSSQ